MKRKLICWLPLLLLIGCSQPTYRTTSLTPDKRAELLLKELSIDDGHFPTGGALGYQTL